MATDPETIPDEIDFSEWRMPVVEDHWFFYLSITFTVVALFRLVKVFGIVNFIHHWLVFLSAMLTPAGRARRTERFKIAAELTELRAKLKTLNMVDQFAQYSRCERRIQALERQLSQTRPETFEVSLFRTVGINVLLFVLEGSVVAWLIVRGPSKPLGTQRLQDANLRFPYVLPFLYALQYVPSKMLMVIWIGLCHSATRPLVAWFKTFVDRSSVLKETKEDIPLDEQ